MAKTIDDLIDAYEKSRWFGAFQDPKNDRERHESALADRLAARDALAAVLPRDGWHTHKSGRRYRVAKHPGLLVPNILIREIGDDRP